MRRARCSSPFGGNETGPEDLERLGFDASDLVEFIDLVSRQDWDVCENALRGVSSRFFERGVSRPEDSLLHGFAERYLAERNGS
jgi:Rieske 2Fe-2S family protein